MFLTNAGEAPTLCITNKGVCRREKIKKIVEFGLLGLLGIIM
jgi:hypothetical protein